MKTEFVICPRCANVERFKAVPAPVCLDCGAYGKLVPPSRKRGPHKDSTGESLFKGLWEALGRDQDYAQEYRFAPEGKPKWLFDFAWVRDQVALEVQGGTWTHGAHSRGPGQVRDYQKNNAAVMAGWCVLHATPDMIRDDPLGLFQMIDLCREKQRKQNKATAYWLLEGVK